MGGERVDQPERHLGPGVGLDVDRDAPRRTAVVEDPDLEVRGGVALLPHPAVGPPPEHAVDHGRRQTDTWLVLFAVNGVRRQSLHRCSGSSPAKRAMRSSSLGQQ